MDITQFFNSPGDFSRIDWNMMKERYWHDTDQDPDRTRRRQAEFLVRDFMPWDLFGIIGVFDDTIGKQVFEITRSAEHQPEIAVHRDWYY